MFNPIVLLVIGIVTSLVGFIGSDDASVGENVDQAAWFIIVLIVGVVIVLYAAMQIIVGQM